MGAVVFDAAAFKVRYPVFSSVADATLQACFDESTLYLTNDDSVVVDETRRAILLNMLTAHIATLGGVLTADGSPLPVGRVSSATEGSVSASLEYATPGSQAWFVQTQYGAAFWQATSSLRGFRYFSQPTVY
jgi:hypothetical protein